MNDDKDDSNDISNDPFQKSWGEIKNKITPIVNCVIIFILFILDIILTNIKYSIIRYINKDYEEENNENNNIINEKETSIKINDNEHKIKIKLNDNIYIKQINSDNIYKFKKILI